VVEEAVSGGEALRHDIIRTDMRISITLAALSFLRLDLWATSCIVPPPCGRIHESSVLFVGTALDAGIPDVPGERDTRAIRFQVDEIFAGIATDTKEVVVATEGTWLIKGHTYLIDAARGNDNRYYPVMCGTSGESSGRDVADVLEYLRLRATGRAKTSLSVSVRGNNREVAGASVVVSGSDGDLKGVAGADGIARFEGIKPGKYHVSAASAHYRVDADSGFSRDVNVIVGSCPFSSVMMESEASVSGLIRDLKGAPVPSLDLELITAPDAATSEFMLLSKPFFTTTTGPDGKFLFDSVSPGRYLLGSNIIGLHSSGVPPTYYPGQPERNGAVPIDVELGEAVQDIAFTLPDFGGSREIQVCVVDEDGKAVAGAGIRAPFGREFDAVPRLGEKLITDETGCVKARGYTKVQYAVGAYYRPPGADFRQSRSSEALMIPPGEEGVVKVLVLGKLTGVARKQ
jgi:hypothetical protein